MSFQSLTSTVARTGIAAACAGALAFSLVGCAGGSSSSASSSSAQSTTPASQIETQKEGGAVTFTDSTGTEVTVENPQRVVACMGSFAHIWELAGGTLVGASNDAFSDYAVTSDAQQVGDFSSLDLESILALDPDFVIMTSAGSGRPGAASQTELADSLRQAGVTVACFTVTTFDDYLSMLKTCTDITGRADLYQQNGTAVADRIAAIKAQVPQGTAPTVMAGITYSGGMRVQGSKTMVGGIVSELGGTNISDSHPSLISDYSVESVIDADPDVILLVPMGVTDDAAQKSLEQNTAENPAWANLTAVQNDRYRALDPKLFVYKPCENWDQAYQEVFDALYR